MSQALAALKARKLNQGTATKSPTKAPIKIGAAKAKAAAEAEADDDEDDEVEAEVAPAKTVKRPLTKKAAVVEEPEEDEDLEDEGEDEGEDEDLDDEDQEEVEEEVVVKPVPKKAPIKSKPAPKKAAVVEEPEEDEDEDLDDEGEDEDLDDEDQEEVEEEVVVKPVPKSKAKVAPAKTTAKVVPAKAAPKSGGLFGSSARTEPKERRVFSEGDHITREEVIRRYAESRGISQADAHRGFADVEAFMLEEIFPFFSVNFFNVKFRRAVTETAYREGAGGLDVVTDGLTTEISSHVAIRAQIYLGKEKRKGMIVKGEFVPGHKNAKGKFVRDTE